MTERPFSQPVIEEGIGKLTYRWDDLKLHIIADRITDEGTAELWFYQVKGKGDKPFGSTQDKQLLHTTKANLLSTSTMNQIAKRMKSQLDTIPWPAIFTFIAAYTMEHQRKNEPSVILKPTDPAQHKPVYYLEPLIMKGVPNILFGDKEVMKTTLALTSLGLMASGCVDSPSGLIAGSQIKVGILDWEANAELTTYTIGRLIQGGTVPYCELPYLHCPHKLIDSIETINRFLADNKIDLVLIDSLGQAAGSERFDSAGKEAAIKFFEALRSFDVTSLIIAQNAKNETGQKTIYGSVYYEYYGRNIFELRKSREVEKTDSSHVALIHYKSNYSRKYKPLGFHLSYTDTTILIEQEEITLDQLKDRIEDSDAVLEYMKLENKACSVKAIANAIDKNENRTRVVLSLLKKRGKIVNVSTGMWGLSAKE